MFKGLASDDHTGRKMDIIGVSSQKEQIFAFVAGQKQIREMKTNGKHTKPGG